MTQTVGESVLDAVQRLHQSDRTLLYLNLTDLQHTDSDFAELVDCLLTHPDIVTDVTFAFNQLTDETGVKLARYLAVSTTIQTLFMEENRLGEATYLAVAAALRTNTSLKELYLDGNDQVERTRIDAAFVDALRLNPARPVASAWMLYEYSDVNDFKRLKHAAEQSGHPSMQMLLALSTDRFTHTMRH